MKILLIGLAAATLATTAATAQSGMPGDMGGSMGGMGGGAGGAGPGSMGRMGSSMTPDSYRRMEGMKPIRRDKMDKPVTEMFRAADTDRDGIVTLEELQGVLARQRDEIIRTRFDRIDANRDHMIDLQEFIGWQTRLGTVASSEQAAMGDNGPIPESLPPVLGKDEEDHALRRLIEPLNATVIASANSNYDKGVSLQELLAYEYKRFDAADVDKDGWLTSEELRVAGPRGREGFGRGGPGARGGSEREGAPGE